MADSSGQGVEVQSQWVRVRAKLRAEYGDAAYRSWLRNMSLQGIDDGRAKIGVPTRFLRDWVAAHYADRIRALWNAENNGVGADSRCQRDQRDHGEYWSASQSAEDLSQLVPKFPHKHLPASRTTFRDTLESRLLTSTRLRGRSSLGRQPALRVSLNHGN